MIRKGDKLKFYRKDTINFLSEFTISEVESIEDGKIKVWIKELPEPSYKRQMLEIVVVDKDGKEYELQSTWGDISDIWGVILKQYRM